MAQPAGAVSADGGLGADTGQHFSKSIDSDLPRVVILSSEQHVFLQPGLADLS